MSELMPLSVIDNYIDGLIDNGYADHSIPLMVAATAWKAHALKAENDAIKHDIERHLSICSELATENEKLRNELAAEREKSKKLEDALTSIKELDPEIHTDHGFNEWGEARCFGLAQEIAEKALAEAPEEKQLNYFDSIDFRETHD